MVTPQKAGPGGPLGGSAAAPLTHPETGSLHASTNSIRMRPRPLHKRTGTRKDPSARHVWAIGLRRGNGAGGTESKAGAACLREERCFCRHLDECD